jgi:hypothetical protein
VFEEKEKWKWDAPMETDQAVTDTFTKFQANVANLTIDDLANSVNDRGSEQNQKGHGQG